MIRITVIGEAIPAARPIVRANLPTETQCRIPKPCKGGGSAMTDSEPMSGEISARDFSSKSHLPRMQIYDIIALANENYSSINKSDLVSKKLRRQIGVVIFFIYDS